MTSLQTINLVHKGGDTMVMLAAGVAVTTRRGDYKLATLIAS